MDNRPENLILVHLRRLDEKVDRLTDDMRDMKRRLTSIEHQLGETRVDLAGVSARIDRMDRRVDGIELRLDRIERRLGINPGG